MTIALPLVTSKETVMSQSLLTIILDLRMSHYCTIKSFFCSDRAISVKKFSTCVSFLNSVIKNMRKNFDT